MNHFIGPQRDLEQGSSHAGYSQDHEYIIVEDRVGTVGITNHAQEKLSDVALVELPHVGEQAKNGGAVGVVESVKAASELYSPVSGEILGVNEVLIGIEADPMWRLARPWRSYIAVARQTTREGQRATWAKPLSVSYLYA